MEKDVWGDWVCRTNPRFNHFKQLKIQRNLNYLKFDSDFVKPNDSSWSFHLCPSSREREIWRSIGVQKGNCCWGWAVKWKWQVKPRLDEGGIHGWLARNHLAFQRCSTVRKLWLWTMAKTSSLGFLVEKRYHWIHHFLTRSKIMFVKQHACDDRCVHIFL